MRQFKASMPEAAKALVAVAMTAKEQVPVIAAKVAKAAAEVAVLPDV